MSKSRKSQNREWGGGPADAYVWCLELGVAFRVLQFGLEVLYIVWMHEAGQRLREEKRTSIQPVEGGGGAGCYFVLQDNPPPPPCVLAAFVCV